MNHSYKEQKELKRRRRHVREDKNPWRTNRLMFESIVVFHRHVNYFELLDQRYVEYLLPNEEKRC